MNSVQDEIFRYGLEILSSDGMKSERKFVQHGRVSCFEHSYRVAQMSVYIADKLHARVDMHSLVRGALLHDYFLYDWHEPSSSHRMHGFTHPRRALENANRDFKLNAVERDIIEKHMFPLNIGIPKYKESAIVCVADKICALRETFMRFKTAKV